MWPGPSVFHRVIHTSLWNPIGVVLVILVAAERRKTLATAEGRGYRGASGRGPLGPKDLWPNCIIQPPLSFPNQTYGAYVHQPSDSHHLQYKRPIAIPPCGAA